MDTNGFPPGIKFCPSDQDLIGYYLTRKLSDQLVLPNFIQILDRQIYGKQLPWEVLTQDDPWAYTWEDGFILKQKEIYVFSRLIQSGNKKRAMRTAGCGTWGGKQVSHNIKQRENVIGKMRSFTFYTNDGVLESNKGRWRMHEYSMDNTDLVICKIIVDNFLQCRSTAADHFVGCKKRKYSDDETVDNNFGAHKRLRGNFDDDQVITGQQEVFSTPGIIEVHDSTPEASTSNEKATRDDLNGGYDSTPGASTSYNAEAVNDDNQFPSFGELMDKDLDFGLDCSWAEFLANYDLENVEGESAEGLPIPPMDEAMMIHFDVNVAGELEFT